MYQFTFWMDEVDEYEDIFVEESSAVTQGAVKHTKYRGNVQQQGTPQNAVNFNNLEEGVFDAHSAISILLMLARQNSWEIEKGKCGPDQYKHLSFQQQQEDGCSQQQQRKR